MRVAALYDIHGMPWALEAVLAEVDADAIVFGGDVQHEDERAVALLLLDANRLRIVDELTRQVGEELCHSYLEMPAIFRSLTTVSVGWAPCDSHFWALSASIFTTDGSARGS